MKRKDLYNYIREEIIGTLSEAGEKTAFVTAQSGETSAVDYKTTDELNKIKDNTDVKSIKTGTGQKIKEMARKAGGYTVGDKSKFDEAKELYSAGLYAEVLNAIEAAGENGITQRELGEKLGKGDGTVLNPILGKFKAIGVFGGGKLAASEKPSQATPETEPEEEMDDFFKADDEEKEETTPEEKPAASDDSELEKIVGKTTRAVANLSPEDEEKFNKLKKGIESKVSRLKDMEAAQRVKSDDLKVLKQLISRDDVKKLFNAKGIDVMDYLKDI